MRRIEFKSARGALVACCALLIAGSLAGCREDEQDRMLIYKKGTYMGAQDEAISGDGLNALRGRANQQGFN